MAFDENVVSNNILDKLNTAISNGTMTGPPGIPGIDLHDNTWHKNYMKIMVKEILDHIKQEIPHTFTVEVVTADATYAGTIIPNP